LRVESDNVEYDLAKLTADLGKQAGCKVGVELVGELDGALLVSQIDKRCSLRKLMELMEIGKLLVR